MAERVRREVPSSPFFLSWLQSFSMVIGLVKACGRFGPSLHVVTRKSNSPVAAKSPQPPLPLMARLGSKISSLPQAGRRARWASIADHIEETNALGPDAARHRGRAAADRRVARPSQTRIHQNLENLPTSGINSEYKDSVLRAYSSLARKLTV